MKKPYIKRQCEISGITVWIVDGEFVRTNLDIEFTNFGQHHRFKFIPENEFWIDKEYQSGEEKFYIDHMLVENRLMSEGRSYDEALMKADVTERKERSKSEHLKNEMVKIVVRGNIMKEVHRSLLKKYKKKFEVWLVNGELVRDMFFIDFTEGGHDRVYRFIPQGEVWIDDDLDPKERRFALIHEIHERNLMVKGWDYDSAHHSASQLEYYCRHHPEDYEKKLREELKKAS